MHPFLRRVKVKLTQNIKYDASFRAVEENIGEIQGRMSSFERECDEGIKTLSNRLTDLERKQDAAHETLVNRLTDLDRKQDAAYETLINRLTDLDRDYNALINRLTDLDRKHDVVLEMYNNRLSDIDQKQNALLQKVETIQNYFEKAYEKEVYTYDVEINGELFSFRDGLCSITALAVAAELNRDGYAWNDIVMNEGDVVIDIGGNVGIASIYLARKFPFIKIYAFEPNKQNYDNFVDNIKLNSISKDIITVENKAVTKDGRTVDLQTSAWNSGGAFISDISGSMVPGYKMENAKVHSTTLFEIFDKYSIDKVKLLKMDCEGSEYEILYNTSPEVLKKIEHLRAELHGDSRLSDKQSPDDLLAFCQQYINDIKVDYYF